MYFLSREAHGAFTVDENTGVITTSSALDREKWASYSFQVFAVDLSPAAPRNSTAQVNDLALNVLLSFLFNVIVVVLTFMRSLPFR